MSPSRRISRRGCEADVAIDLKKYCDLDMLIYSYNNTCSFQLYHVNGEISHVILPMLILPWVRNRPPKKDARLASLRKRFYDLRECTRKDCLERVCVEGTM